MCRACTCANCVCYEQCGVGCALALAELLCCPCISCVPVQSGSALQSTMLHCTIVATLAAP